MKRLSALCWLVVLVGGVSCGSGSMSAPPVSLPAPISGRLDGPITVGDQGGDSRISISAPAGTVAPHATILIINTTAELSLNLQISPAVSAICAQPTRTCVTADDVGAFAAAISCRNGETLALVVIDPENGKEVGPRRYVTLKIESTGVASGGYDDDDTVATAPSTEGDGQTDGGANDYEVERVSVGYSTIMIDGKIKITSVTLYSYDNSAGMVKPFSTVMATNESIAEPYAFNRTKSSWTQRAVAFLLRQLQRLGISEALADLFPPICYTYGRACAMAGESGEFKTQVVAFEGDKIIISVIDPKTGEELFRISRVLIPLGAWDASGSGAGTDSTGSGSNGSGSTGSSGGSVTSGTGSVTGGTVPCLVESGTVYRYGQPVAGTTCADAGSGATSTGSGTTSTEQLKGKK